MDELFKVAEFERNELRHPYVGTEHLLLAYLKIYGNKYVSYDEFRECVIKVVGCSYKESEYLLYTPILRDIKNSSDNIYDAMVKVLTDDDSIAYNMLLSNGYDIESIYLDIINRSF